MRMADVDQGYEWSRGFKQFANNGQQTDAMIKHPISQVYPDVNRASAYRISIFGLVGVCLSQGDASLSSGFIQSQLAFHLIPFFYHFKHLTDLMISRPLKGK